MKAQWKQILWQIYLNLTFAKVGTKVDEKRLKWTSMTLLKWARKPNFTGLLEVSNYGDRPDNIAGTELTSTRKIRVTRVPPNFASVFCRLRFLSLTDISHCMASRLLCQMPPRSPGRNPTENVFNTGKKNRWRTKSGKEVHLMYFSLDALLIPPSTSKAGAHQESLTEKLFQAILFARYLPSHLPQVILHMS